ncbi:chaperonin 10-like protein [Lentinula lateritia]|uniref:Chaperonin 10-like protein n=1 Tax=Lentinula lateritia TaxID=40482 RepID=A0ABQ8VLL4_9AGAR|nr:chaperonin 10-like protein [Lentinula lateritia]
MPALPTSTAAVLHGPKDLRLEPRPLWAPEPGQCQLEVKSTGLCGSDLHYYLSGRNGDFAIRSPLVLGHESSGVITALGAGVASQYPHLRVGVRVAIECGIPCRSLNSDGSARTAKDVCKHCSNSRYNLCKNLRFCSSAKTFPHRDGMLQQKINHEAWCLHPGCRIPDSVSYSQAALAEPLSVLLHASRRAGICPASSYPSLGSSSLSTTSPSSSAAGKKVLVFGVGAIGLIACALAQELGAERVCAVDINNDRLAFAARENFTTSEGNSTYCLPLPPKIITSMESNPKEPENIRRAKENAANALAVFDEPDGFDVIFECTGAESCVLMSVFCTTLGARIALVGMGSPILSSFPISAAATREVDLIGSFRYADTYNEAVELLSGSNLLTSSCKGGHTNGVQAVQNAGFSQKLSKLVTHRYPLNQAKEAFELLARGRDDHGGMVLKVMIES